MKKLTVFISILLILPPFSARAASIQDSPSHRISVGWEPNSLVNGSPCLFRVRPSHPLRSLWGEWQGRRVYFDFDAANGTWYGLAGIEIDTAPGHHSLTLEATLTTGVRIPSRHTVSVGKAAYRTIALRVSREFTEPDWETLARINKERAIKDEVFRRTTKNRLWSGSFVIPINSVTTEAFGVQRTFNRVRQTVHRGLDFNALARTPVGAINSGIVILASDMFFEGGLIVIDHGQGLMTLYMHLSEFSVNEGESVSKGQIIGLSGATGRVTGPHLHLGVRWQGMYLDPAKLFAINLN